MALYKHGIRGNEAATEVMRPLKGTAGLQVVFGTAPVNLAENPMDTANKLFYCEDYASAVKFLGYSDDFKKYSLCQSMLAMRTLNIAPVLFVNVLDPKKHKETITDQSVNVTNMKAVMDDKGILLDTVVVKNASTPLVLNTDYVLAFDSDGRLNISLVSSGSASAATTLTVTADKIKPEMVTESDVIGGYDVIAGKETGIELVRQVFLQFGVAPGLLLAPGWSDKPNVAAALQGKCEKINGKFSCMCLLDVSVTSAAKYTDVKRTKKELGATSQYAIALWPKVKIAGSVIAYSAVFGALCAYLDASNDNVPNIYPSNKVIPSVVSGCLDDGTEVYLDELQGNILNAEGVVTIINQVGVRAWGNNTAAYPTTNDPKDRWIAVRRSFCWYENEFVIRFTEKVDNPTNYRLIESFIDAENIAGNALVAQDKFAGVKFRFDPAQNPTSQILNGEIKFTEAIAPYTPAEYIENTFSFDPTMITTALGGGK